MSSNKELGHKKDIVMQAEKLSSLKIEETLKEK